MTEASLHWLPRDLLDRIPAAVLVTDARVEPPGPRILYANPAWEKMSGCTLAEVVGQTPSMVLERPQADARTVSLDRLRGCLEKEHGPDGADNGHCGSGTSAWSIELLHEPKGSVVGFGFVERGIEPTGHTDVANALDVIRELQHLLDHTQLDLKTARQQVAYAAMRLAGAEAAVVEEPDGEEMVYRAVAGCADGLENLRLPMYGSASGYCHSSCESLLIADTLTDERVPLGGKAADVGFRSGILTPLVHGDRRFGVLKVFSGVPDSFGRTEGEFLDILAGLLAAVLYRARSYESEAERRRHLVDALPMLVAYVDSNRCYREVNAAYADWFGHPIGEIIGRPVREIVGESAYERIRPHIDHVLNTGESVSYEETITLPGDSPRVLSVDYAPNLHADGAVAGFYALVRDVTKASAADTDHLTQLPNRRRFEEEAQRQLEVSRRHGRTLSLIFADVDHFKWWNDTLGHQTGDRILESIATQLRDEARNIDLVARWGGEEFVILAPETDLNGAQALAERIRQRIAATYQPEGELVTLSFGVAEAQSESLSLSNLMRAADTALYAAKTSGRNCVKTA